MRMTEESQSKCRIGAHLAQICKFEEAGAETPADVAAARWWASIIESMTELTITRGA
jgi:hypothetical protein